MHPTFLAPTQMIGGAVFVLLLGGCATFSPDGGIGAVQRLARERISFDVTLPTKRTDSSTSLAAAREILGKPLSVDDAVQVALLNNAALKARFAELGIAESELVQAGRLANPRFTFSNRRSSDVTSIDRTVLFNVMSLLAMPLAQKVAGRQFERAAFMREM